MGGTPLGHRLLALADTTLSLLDLFLNPLFQFGILLFELGNLCGLTFDFPCLGSFSILYLLDQLLCLEKLSLQTRYFLLCL